MTRGRSAKFFGRLQRAIFLLLVIKIDQGVAVEAVSGEQNQDDEIRDEQGHVEAVGFVQPFEGGVEEVLANVLREAALGKQNGEGWDWQGHVYGDGPPRRKASRTGRLYCKRGSRRAGQRPKAIGTCQAIEQMTARSLAPLEKARGLRYDAQLGFELAALDREHGFQIEPLS